MYFLSPFLFNDTATPEIYTLSLHDALPISRTTRPRRRSAPCRRPARSRRRKPRRERRTSRRTCRGRCGRRSEEHTSELQSRRDLVCRLLLEKKKKIEIREKLDRNKMTSRTD